MEIEKKCLILLLVSLILVSPGSAQFYNWTQTTEEDWNNATNLTNVSLTETPGSVVLGTGARAYTVDGDTDILLHMNEAYGPTAIDAAGLEDGTLTGTSYWAVGKYGNGSSSYNGVAFPLGAANTERIWLADFFDAPPAAGTHEIWFKLNETFDIGNGTSRYIFVSEGAANSILVFLNQADGKLTFMMFNPGAKTVISTTTSWTGEQWYHVAISWGADGQRLWVNGVKEVEDGGEVGAPQSGGVGNTYGIGGHPGGGAYTPAPMVVDEFRASDIQRTTFEFSYFSSGEIVSQVNQTENITKGSSILLNLTVNGTFITECAPNCNITAHLDYSVDNVTWFSTPNNTTAINGSIELLNFSTLGILTNFIRVNLTLITNNTSFTPMLNNFTVWYINGTNLTNRVPIDNAVNQEVSNLTLSGLYENYFYNETANITFYLDWANGTDELLATNSNVANNTTTSYLLGGLDYGEEYCWFVEINSSNFTVNISSYCFTTKAGMVVYEESHPTTPIISTINIVFANNTMSWETTTTANGSLNITGIPLTEKITMSTNESSDYYPRTILLINGLSGVSELYILPKTSNAVTNTFQIADYTGGTFSEDGTMIVLKRWLNGSEKIVAGGYRGVGNSYGAILHLGAAYNVYITTADGSETRSLGIYYAQQSGTITLSVGFTTYPRETIIPGQYALINVEPGVTRYSNNTISDAWVTVKYHDTNESTTWVNISIYNQNRTKLYTSNVTSGSYLVTFTYHFNLSNISITDRFIVTLDFSSSPNVTRGYSFDFFLMMLDLPTRLFQEELGLKPEYVTILGIFILLFMSMIFSFTFSDIGGIITVVFGGILVAMNILPQDEVGMGVLILAGIIAFLNAIYVKRKRGTI